MCYDILGTRTALETRDSTLEFSFSTYLPQKEFLLHSRFSAWSRSVCIFIDIQICMCVCVYACMYAACFGMDTKDWMWWRLWLWILGRGRLCSIEIPYSEGGYKAQGCQEWWYPEHLSFTRSGLDLIVFALVSLFCDLKRGPKWAESSHVALLSIPWSPWFREIRYSFQH